MGDKKPIEKKYTKGSILKSKVYKGKKDLINALLEDNERYTKSEVSKLLEDYSKKEV